MALPLVAPHSLGHLLLGGIRFVDSSASRRRSLSPPAPRVLAAAAHRRRPWSQGGPFLRGSGPRSGKVYPFSSMPLGASGGPGASRASSGAAAATSSKARVTFREAVSTEEECRRVCQMVNDAYRKEGNWTNEVGVVAGDRVTPNRLRGVLKPGDGGGPDSRTARMIVAVDEDTGAVVGCVEAGYEEEEGGRLVGTVGMLSVDYRFGSRGIGSGLVKEAEASVQRWWGCKVAQMWVVGARSDILAWYTRSGYSDTGRRVEPAPLLESIDNNLLQECDFHILEKPLT